MAGTVQKPVTCQTGLFVFCIKINFSSYCLSSATFEKLDLALTEIEQQKGLLRELEVLSDRLKKSEGLAAERLADITSLQGKIKSNELTIRDLSEEVEQANIKRLEKTRKISRNYY